MSTPTQINEEYDIIIAGSAPSSSPLPSTLPFSDRVRSIGGAAGCIVAGRLAVADPDLHILILEVGSPMHNNPAHRQPGCFLSQIAPGSRTVRVHASRPSAALENCSTFVPCGQCLGGGESVNCTSTLRTSRGVYTRESAADYMMTGRWHTRTLNGVRMI